MPFDSSQLHRSIRFNSHLVKFTSLYLVNKSIPAMDIAIHIVASILQFFCVFPLPLLVITLYIWIYNHWLASNQLFEKVKKYLSVECNFLTSLLHQQPQIPLPLGVALGSNIFCCGRQEDAGEQAEIYKSSLLNHRNGITHCTSVLVLIFLSSIFVPF